MTDGSNLAEQSTTQTQTSQQSELDQNGGQGNQSSGQQTQGTGQQSGAEGNHVDMSKIFGEDFAKDPNLAKFKTPAEVMKSYKELQSQIGKPRFDVPAQDAPPEQVSDFYKKLGVPETPDAYDLKPDANIPEHNDETNVAFLKAFGDIAHELKLTTGQAKGMQKFFDDLTVKINSEQTAAMEASDEQLDEMLTKALGDDKAVATERIKQTLEKVLPPEMRPLIAEKMSNEALLALSLLDKHYQATYGKSDQNIGDEGKQTGKSLADLRKEAQDLMATKEYQNPIDPGHRAMKERVNAAYKSIGELTTAAQRK